MKTLLIIVLTIAAGIELGEAAIDSLQQSNMQSSKEVSQAPVFSEGAERNQLNYYTGFSRKLALSE